jgi:hypothetical protein
MDLETAKKLQFNDKILIKYPNTTILGRFFELSRNGYIYYTAPWTPPNQKAHRSIVELHFDTMARLKREEGEVD